MTAEDRALGRVAFWLTVAAFAWAVFLVVRVAAYDGYVADYGGWILAAHAIPAFLVALGWLMLHELCTTGSRTARPLAWAVAFVLLAFSILGGFSIGFLAWYSALALIAAAGLTPLGGGATGGRSGSPA